MPIPVRPIAQCVVEVAVPVGRQIVVPEHGRKLVGHVRRNRVTRPVARHDSVMVRSLLQDVLQGRVPVQPNVDDEILVRQRVPGLNRDLLFGENAERLQNGRTGSVNSRVLRAV